MSKHTTEKNATRRTLRDRFREAYYALMIWWSDRRYGKPVRVANPSDDWSDLGYWDGR